MDKEMIEIELTHLGSTEARQARYLAAVARYRELAAEFAAAGHADLDELRVAAEEVDRWQAPESERLRPIREVAATTGVSVATIRRWAAEGQVVAEKRYGKLWYVLPEDVELLVASEEPRRRGWPLGKARIREQDEEERNEQEN